MSQAEIDDLNDKIRVLDAEIEPLRKARDDAKVALARPQADYDAAERKLRSHPANAKIALLRREMVPLLQALSADRKVKREAEKAAANAPVAEPAPGTAQPAPAQGDGDADTGGTPRIS